MCVCTWRPRRTLLLVLQCRADLCKSKYRIESTVASGHCECQCICATLGELLPKDLRVVVTSRHTQLWKPARSTQFARPCFMDGPLVNEFLVLDGREQSESAPFGTFCLGGHASLMRVSLQDGVSSIRNLTCRLGVVDGDRANAPEPTKRKKCSFAPLLLFQCLGSLESVVFTSRWPVRSVYS